MHYLDLQATIGAREDGIMTSELLERLYMEQRIDTGTNTSTDEKGTIPTVPPKVHLVIGNPNGYSIKEIVY